MKSQNLRKNTRFDILSSEGEWESFDGVIKNSGERYGREFIFSDGLVIRSTLDHRFYKDGSEIAASKIKIGDVLDGIDKPTVSNIKEIVLDEVFDIFNSDSHKILCHNKVFSHQCDEFAFIQPSKQTEFWTAIQPTLSTGGSCIITSTPKNDEDIFAQIYKAAIDNTDEFGNILEGGRGRNGFFAVTSPWWENPERDEEWARPYREQLGEARFRQEFECCVAETKVRIRSGETQKIVALGDLFKLLQLTTKEPQTAFMPNALGLKVLTADGYKSFAGIALVGDRPIVTVDFSNGNSLECSSRHRLVCPHGILQIDELKVGDRVYRSDGRCTTIRAINYTDRVEPVYDLIEVEGGHVYVTNGVQSKNCEFITDDETLINPLMLSRMKSVDPEYYTGTVRWYADILPNKTYLVGLDPSLGTGSDYSALQVFMLPEMIQVGEWQHNKTNPRDQVRRLMQVLLFLDATMRDDPEQHGEPEIYWTVENNSIGEAILMTIEDTGEERFPGTFVSEKKRKGQTRRFRKGMNTDNRKKLAACARFKNLIETDRMLLNSKPLIRELKNFVHKESSFGAKPGEHDDLIMATMLVVRMLDVVLSWGTDAGDLKEYIGDDELFEQEAMPVVI